MGQRLEILAAVVVGFVLLKAAIRVFVDRKLANKYRADGQIAKYDNALPKPNTEKLAEIARLDEYRAKLRDRIRDDN